MRDIYTRVRNRVILWNNRRRILIKLDRLDREDDSLVGGITM